MCFSLQQTGVILYYHIELSGGEKALEMAMAISFLVDFIEQAC